MLYAQRLPMLLELARHGSITAAAQQLGYTAPAVSQSLAALEREVGVALFERGPRSIRLTEAGRRLAIHAEVIQSALASAEAEMRSFAGLDTGTLRIAAFPSAAAAFLPELIDAVHKQLPEIQIVFEELSPPAALASVRRGEVDLAIVYDFADTPISPTSDVQLVRLGYDPFRLCVSRASELSKLEKVSLEMARELPWIADGQPPAESCFSIRYLRSRGIDPVITARSDDLVVIHRLVAAGAGVAMLPRLQMAGHADVADVSIVRPPPARRILRATRTASESSTLLRAVIPLLGPLLRLQQSVTRSLANEKQ